ncbi:MAG: ABC transporter substrate-binding protein [Planctomycetes bacterium]|nr:ABC transporter substrate-binding protein [Planctomycetota bacterium]MBL7039186.1 ABC transporter substrate-binding protein [Pirellulaceae bacterium]
MELWNDPITTVGKASFVDQLITRAGGVNVAHELDSDYPTLSPERIVDWNPDVIVLGYMNQQAPKEALAKRIGRGDVEAARRGNESTTFGPTSSYALGHGLSRA